MKLYFLAKRGNGGLGDRFVGILTAMTFARLFNLELVVLWNEGYIKRVFENVIYTNDVKELRGIHYRLMNHRSLPKAKKIIYQFKPDSFQLKHLILECNQAYDTLCYDVKWMREKLPKSYQENLQMNLSQLFTSVLIPKIKVHEIYDVGIQIRSGDVQFHQARDKNIIFIHKSQFSEYSQRIINILHSLSFETIYITGDNEDYVKDLIMKVKEVFPEKKVYDTLVGKNYHSDKLMDRDGIISFIQSILNLSRANTHIISNSNFGIIAANIGIAQHHKTGKTYYFKKPDEIIEYPPNQALLKESDYLPNYFYQESSLTTNE